MSESTGKVTEQTEQTAAGNQPQRSGAEGSPLPQPQAARDPVRVWTLILIGLCFVLLIIYLRADRFTPYTSQARLNGLVVPVAAQVSGEVISVSVTNNQPVVAGQELFQVDPESYELAVSSAKANLEAARQAVGASAANVDAARAALTSARANLANATQEYARLQRIRDEDSGAVSERRVESASTAREVAAAQVESAQANLKRALEDLGQEGEQNSRVLQAQSALNQARINLDNATVTAPAQGVVTDVRIDRGNFAAAGAAQMTFIGTANLWVQADFTENNLGHIDPGDAVEVLFDVIPGRVFTGIVREIGYGVQVDSAALGSLPTIRNNRDWLRDAQRFPVLVDLSEDISPNNKKRLKVGSQASVVVYTGDHAILAWLGKLHIRLDSILTYAY